MVRLRRTTSAARFENAGSRLTPDHAGAAPHCQVCQKKRLAVHRRATGTHRGGTPPPVAAQGVPTAVIPNPRKGVYVTAFSILREVPQILRLTQVRDRAPAARERRTV